MKYLSYIILLLTLGLTACAEEKKSVDHDAIVIGAGIAGLSSALELARGGADVLIVDMNSVAGGHAVMAGGFAFADSPLQRSKGIEDSPEKAFEDWMAWGETNDPDWTKRYAEQSTPMVYDWLTELGVKFLVLLPSYENSVLRFHFTRGKAVHAVLPIYQELLHHENVSIKLHTEAISLVKEEGRISGVRLRDVRMGEEETRTARSVVIATGGFQGALDEVRRNWNGEAPEDILVGASSFALGKGHQVANEAGAGLTRLGDYVTFPNGLKNPRNPEHAIVISNSNMIWVNEKGVRFVNEQTTEKEVLPAVLKQTGAYYAIVDQAGAKAFRTRGPLWLNGETFKSDILENADVTKKAETLGDLEALMKLPSGSLDKTVARYNAQIDAGVDEDFGRFTAGDKRLPKKLEQGPYYAFELHPLTRKNLGGIAINQNTEVLDEAGNIIPGLYAAGEVTGVAGINGSHGMSGTFLGPSVFMGRLAGQEILTSLKPKPAPAKDAFDESPMEAEMKVPDISSMLGQSQPGYWHFEQVHNLVLEQGRDCQSCHSEAFPMTEAMDRKALYQQSQICLQCH